MPTRQSQPLSVSTPHPGIAQAPDSGLGWVWGLETYWAQCGEFLKYLTESSMMCWVLQALITFAQYWEFMLRFWPCTHHVMAHLCLQFGTLAPRCDG